MSLAFCDFNLSSSFLWGRGQAEWAVTLLHLSRCSGRFSQSIQSTNVYLMNWNREGHPMKHCLQSRDLCYGWNRRGCGLRCRDALSIRGCSHTPRGLQAHTQQQVAKNAVWALGCGLVLANDGILNVAVGFALCCWLCCFRGSVNLAAPSCIVLVAYCVVSRSFFVARENKRRVAATPMVCLPPSLFLLIIFSQLER